MNCKISCNSAAAQKIAEAKMFSTFCVLSSESRITSLKPESLQKEQEM